MTKTSPVTQKDLIDLSNTILHGVEHMLAGMEKRTVIIEKRTVGLEKGMSGVEKRMSGVEKRMSGVEKRMTNIEEHMTHMDERNMTRFDQLSNEINVLHKFLDDFSKNVVSKKEFDALKDKVYRHHPTN